MKRGEQRRGFYPTGAMPLLAKCGVPKSTVGGAVDEHVLARYIVYLKSLGVLDYPGGIPTSLKESGQQWDFPVRLDV